MTEILTDRQQQVYDFINQTIMRKGYPPTIMEIAHRFGFSSPTTVTDHLKALERKGYVERPPGTSRGLRLTKNTFRETRTIPVIGRVAAGEPILAQENIEGSLTLDAELVSSGEVFSLRIEGESMTGAGIMPGDYAMIRRQQTAEDGEIVVAILDGEATVKRLKRRGKHIMLTPENPEMQPIQVKDPETFEIIGKLIGIYRKV